MSASDKPVDTMKPVAAPTSKPAPLPTTSQTSNEVVASSEVIVYKPPPKSVFQSYFDKTKAGVSSRANPDKGFFSLQSIKEFGTALYNGDAKSGIAVAFISLPLSLALSIASGGTPLMGLATAACEFLVIVHY